MGLPPRCHKQSQADFENKNLGIQNNFVDAGGNLDAGGDDKQLIFYGALFKF
jgi:hypothetical protein